MNDPRITPAHAPPVPMLPPDVWAALEFWRQVRHAQRPTIVTVGGGPVPVGVHTVTEPPLSSEEHKARDAAADLLETYFARAALGYQADMFGDPDDDD